MKSGSPAAPSASTTSRGLQLPGISLDSNLTYYYFVLVVTLLLGGAAVGAAALALGQGVHRAARQPDPRREPGREHPGLHAAVLCHRRGVRRHCRRAVRQPGAVHRTGAVRRGCLDHDVPDGGGRRPGLLLRPAAGLGGGRAAARVAALCPGLVPVRVRYRGGAADAVAARWPAEHSRPPAGQATWRARPRRRAAAAAAKLGASS